jgi:hypothetical protein
MTWPKWFLDALHFSAISDFVMLMPGLTAQVINTLIAKLVLIVSLIALLIAALATLSFSFFVLYDENPTWNLTEII